MRVNPLSRFISTESLFFPKLSLRSITNHTLKSPSLSTSAKRPISSMASSFKPEQARVPSALPLPAPPLTKFNIGLCQLSVTADKIRNISHAKNAIEQAASKGAQLVLLPLQRRFGIPWSFFHIFEDYEEDLYGNAMDFVIDENEEEDESNDDAEDDDDDSDSGYSSLLDGVDVGDDYIMDNDDDDECFFDF